MMLQNFFVCFLISLSFVETDGAASVRPSQVVQVSGGKIQGKTYTFENGQEGTAFLGIKYGKAPVGPLRFKKPLPAESWTGVQNASQFGSVCYQSPVTALMSEDCLHLNVFAPGSKFNQVLFPIVKRPIAFFIHGGGFFIGYSNSYGSENISRYWNTKDVIVVTINYRLQHFGFLALDEETRGNYGLWDMKLALEWVRKNAHVFGGDVNRITVYGQSAGAMSSDLFTISPHTNKLFNSAIMFAGNSYMNVVTNKIDTLRYYARRFAVSVGFEVNDTLTYEEENDALREFFETAPATTITIGYIASNESSSTLLTAPSLDGDFFPQSLDVLRQKAPKKPTIAGVTAYEGLLFVAAQNYSLVYNYTKNYLVNYYPKNRPQINSTTAEAIMQTFVDTSLPSNTIEFYTQCVNVMSDFLFNYPTWKMVKDRAGKYHQLTYFYNFTYFDNGTFPGTYPALLRGPSHTLEIPYVFAVDSLVPTWTPNQADIAKLEVFVSSLVKFIKTGIPPFSWKPYNPLTNKYYNFGQNTSEDGMKCPFGAGRMAKWDELYNRFNLN